METSGLVNDLEKQVETIVADWMKNGIIDIIDDSNDSPFDSSESEEDENDGEPPAQKRRLSEKNYVAQTVRTLSDSDFKDHFKLSRQTVSNLINVFRITKFLKNVESHKAVNHENALMMTLSYLTTTESFKELSNRFDFSPTFGYKVLELTLDFINSLTEKYITWPMSEAKKKDISRKFSQNRYMFGIIGVIDTFHIRIKQPVVNDDEYLNDKKYHSIILQGVVNHRKVFTDVYIGEPGSMPKERVLRRSQLHENARDDSDFFGDFFILGDSSYPSLPWLVPPFASDQRLTSKEQLFNYRHTYALIKAQQTFVSLRHKFRRLLHLSNLPFHIITKCVMAMCILHNIIILNNESDESDSDDENNNRSNIIFDDNYKTVDRRRLTFYQMFLNNL